jgi:hypothetical protein
MQTTAKHIASLLFATTLLPNFAIAQNLFKDLRDKMKQAVPTEPVRRQGVEQSKGPGSSQKGLGQICRDLLLPASKRSKDEVDSLLRLHFKVGSNEFFNQALAAVSTNSGASPAVSHLGLFGNNFESAKANALYAAFLSWPEPEVMAEIIASTNDKNDQQLANDATVMLILVLRSMPNAAINPQSWKSLVPGLEQKEHIPSACLSARFFATGEVGRQSVKLATSEYARCAALPLSYKDNSRHIPITLDLNSYVEVDLISKTLALLFQVNQAETVRELSRVNPGGIQQLLQMATQLEAAQKQFKQQFYQTPVGELTKAGIQAATVAQQKGEALIASSQQMSRAYGDFQANIRQIEQRQQGLRDGTVVIDPAISVRLDKMGEVFKKADDADAKGITEVRYYQGASALALGRAKLTLELATISQSKERFQKSDYFGAAVVVASTVQVLQDLSIETTRACRTLNSFQQAARARNTSTDDDDRASEGLLQSMMAKKGNQ